MSSPAQESFFPERPECNTLEDYRYRLQELYTVDEDIVERYRPQLWDTAQKVANSLVDPTKQAAIQIYAGIVDWELFGKPGDPLPLGLHLYKDGHKTTIAPDNTQPHGIGHMPETIRQEFESVGNMREIVQNIYQEQRASKGAETTATFAGMLRQTAEYQLFASFDTPERQPEPQPLNAYWRQIRSSQIEHEVRDAYGYGQEESISAGSPAHHELSRRYYHLDNESAIRSRQSAGSADGLRRAKAYLTPYLATDGSTASIEMQRDHYSDSESVVVAYQAPDGSQPEEAIGLYPVAEKIAEELSDRIYVGPADMQFLAKIFTCYAIEYLLDPRASSVTDALEQAIMSTMGEFDATLVDAIIHDYPGQAHLLLRTPQAPIIDAPTLPMRWNEHGSWVNLSRDYPSFSTRSKLLQQQNMVKGSVREYGPDHFQVPARLILQTLCEIPDEGGQEDLVVKLYDYTTAADPLIPGYKLTSKTAHGRYGFEAASEGDPYTPCLVPINEQQRAELAKAYHDMGLHTLARQLELPAHMTVSNLAWLISHGSTYQLPETQLGSKDTIFDRYKRTRALTDFSYLVRDDRLLVQCTASALFLKHSLDAAFGQGSASTLAGLTLRPNRDIINGVRHAQTVFTHDNRQYIIDAGASLASNDSEAWPQHHGGFAQNRRAPKTSELTLPESNKPAETREVRPSKTKDEEIADLLASFIERAKVAFDLPTDRRLGEFLVRLPKQDPARRTYETLRQFQIGRIDAKRLGEQARYVIQCAQATPEMRKNLGINHYSHQFYSSLDQ